MGVQNNRSIKSVLIAQIQSCIDEILKRLHQQDRCNCYNFKTYRLDFMNTFEGFECFSIDLLDELKEFEAIKVELKYDEKDIFKSYFLFKCREILFKCMFSLYEDKKVVMISTPFLGICDHD